MMVMAREWWIKKTTVCHICYMT